jgi:hypothetical protein
VGAAALRYADTLNTGAAAITPHVLLDWGLGFVDATGTYSQFTAGGWSTQAALSASRFISVADGFFVEVGGFAGGSSHNDGTRTGEVLANGRLHFTRAGGELFFGGAGGQTWDGGAWSAVFLGEAGASIGAGPRTALFTISPAMVNDSIKYADAQASFSLMRERLDLGALLGIRFGDQLTASAGNTKSWANVTAVGWMTPRLGVAVSGGTYPIDPTQGFPGGRFVSLSLRIATGRQGARQSNTQPSPGSSRPNNLVPVLLDFSAERDRQGLVTLKVNSPRAQRVEISGDFTNWVPVLLDPVSATTGIWSVALPIRPGKYEMNVRVDGGEWLVPPGLLSMVDEFGGSVGLLVIE